MPDRVRKRPSTAKALARWDDEGGATKGMPQEDRDALISLGQEEARILRCLVAVIMQWNELPTDVQHELLNSAISMGRLRQTAELKRRIARFLHQHNKDREPGSSPARLRAIIRLSAARSPLRPAPAVIRRTASPRAP